MKLICHQAAVFVFIWSSAFAFCQEKRYPEPLDFQDDSVTETFTQSIRQLESDGSSLFIRTENAHILQIDRQGQLLGVHSIPEEGPHHAKQIATFAIKGDKLALINKQRRVYVVKDQQVLSTFRTDSFTFQDFYPMANAMGFGFDGAQFIIPSQKEKKVAVVLDKKGDLTQRVGDQVRFPDDLKWDSTLFNATFWVHESGHWYALHKFKPLLQVYDQNLKLIRSIELASEEIFESDAQLYDPSSEMRQKIRMPLPHFNDFKVRGDTAYALCRGALLKIDLKKGEIVANYHFFGRGKGFEHVVEGQKLNFMEVAILDDGHVVLAHPALLWDHDLWVAKL